MPKDMSDHMGSSDSITEDIHGGGAGSTIDRDGTGGFKAPLKRGDACLYCRKRRIRCSADKPTCQHCAKLRRECIYDQGKPVSRVKQLEDKVAELEDLLRTGTGTGSSGGGGGGGGGGDQGRASAPAAANGSLGAAIGVADGSTYPSGGQANHPSLAGLHSTSGTSSSYSGGSSSVSPGLSDPSVLAGLENPLLSAKGLGPSTSTQGFDSALYGFSGNPAVQQPTQTFDFMFASTSRLTEGPDLTQSTSRLAFPISDPSVEQLFDFSTLDPSFMNLVNTFAASDTGGGVGAAGGVNGVSGSEGLAVNPFSMESPNTFFANMMGPAAQGVPSTAPVAGAAIGVNGILDVTSTSHYAPFANPGSANDDAGMRAATESMAIELDETGAQSSRTSFTSAGPSNGSTNGAFQDRAGVGAEAQQHSSKEGDLAGLPLVGGWYDAADLPKVARDHLLDLFFQRMHDVGQEIHVPRFFAALSLPAPKRPHPCLLYSMYLIASRFSTHPPIRALEPHFYSIAQKRLEESIAGGDRLLDATRAATILSVYKYSLARFHEGLMMSSTAMRLAISCGLHQIPSPVWKPPSGIRAGTGADLIGIMRKRAYVIQPPSDSIDLGERIAAFWAIYIVDRAGAVSFQAPCCIADEDICTPYPKPLYEYEMGLVSEADNDSSWSMLEPRMEHIRRLQPYSEAATLTLRLRAISLLEKAGKLMYTRPERGWESAAQQQALAAGLFTGATPDGGTDSRERSASTDSGAFGYTGASRPSPTGAGGWSWDDLGGGAKAQLASQPWTRCARIRTPKAYEDIRQALLRVEEDLPPERRTRWDSWDGEAHAWYLTGAKKDTVTLHFVLGCAWMYLFDNWAYNVENNLAVNVARRLACAVKTISATYVITEMDVFIAMCWTFVSRMLVRESKRLHSLGRPADAKPIEDDIESIMEALRAIGKKYDMAAYQVLRIQRYRVSSLDELRFMQEETFHDEVLAFDSPC